MADQADVLDALQVLCTTSCFPNGTSSPSVTTRVIAIGQGWPLAADIDHAIAAGQTLVSIYPIPGTTGIVQTPFDWNPGTVVAPVHGISAVVTDAGFTLTGAPNACEYATAIVNGRVYGYTAAAGDTAQTMAAALAAQISAALPGSSWASASNGASVTALGAYSVVVRIGAPATVGQIVHRQRQNFQITVWGPTPADRTAVSRAIDVALKRSNTLPMPDTSEAIVLAQGSNLDDKRQETSGYHRTLLFSVEWDTLDEYPAYEVTAPITFIPHGGSTASATS